MLNLQSLRKLLMLIIGMSIVWCSIYLIRTTSETQPASSAYLSKPISNKMILITSAGQSTDTYILQDMSNELRFNNLFMPEANESDLQDISSMLVVVGFSDIGLSLHDKTIEEEIDRVSTLIDASTSQGIPSIVVYIGGKARRCSETDALLKITCEKASYIITTNDGNNDHFLTELAQANKIPISYISSLTELTKPLSAAFR